MRKKCITVNCAGCEKMSVNDMNQMLCGWGKGEPKLLEPQKGKKPLNCRLIEQ